MLWYLKVRHKNTLTTYGDNETTLYNTGSRTYLLIKIIIHVHKTLEFYLTIYKVVQFWKSLCNDITNQLQPVPSFWAVICPGSVPGRCIGGSLGMRGPNRRQPVAYLDRVWDDYSFELFSWWLYLLPPICHGKPTTGSSLGQSCKENSLKLWKL